MSAEKQLLFGLLTLQNICVPCDAVGDDTHNEDAGQERIACE